MRAIDLARSPFQPKVESKAAHEPATLAAVAAVLLAAGPLWPVPVAVVVLAALVSMCLGVHNGLRTVDRRLLEAMHALRLNAWERLRHVYLPAVLPSVLAGARQALAVGILMLATTRLTPGVALFGVVGWLLADAVMRSLRRWSMAWQR